MAPKILSYPHHLHPLALHESYWIFCHCFQRLSYFAAYPAFQDTTHCLHSAHSLVMHVTQKSHDFFIDPYRSFSVSRDQYKSRDRKRSRDIVAIGNAACAAWMPHCCAQRIYALYACNCVLCAFATYILQKGILHAVSSACCSSQCFTMPRRVYVVHSSVLLHICLLHWILMRNSQPTMLLNVCHVTQ